MSDSKPRPQTACCQKSTRGDACGFLDACHARRLGGNVLDNRQNHSKSHIPLPRTNRRFRLADDADFLRKNVVAEDRSIRVVFLDASA
jgi:hypothetical protein